MITFLFVCFLDRASESTGVEAAGDEGPAYNPNVSIFDTISSEVLEKHKDVSLFFILFLLLRNLIV